MTAQPDPQTAPELVERCRNAMIETAMYQKDRTRLFGSYSVCNWDEVVSACLAALPDAGGVLVPREPTEEMLAAYFDALVYPVTERSKPWHRVKAIKRWKAMLAALPAMVKEKD